MSKKSERLAYWTKLNSQWEASGLSQEKFCIEQGVVYKQFVYWRAQVLNRNKQACEQPKLLCVAPLPQQAAQPSMTAQQPETLQGLEVSLPSGVVLHIKSTSDIGKASALLKQLGGGLC